MNLLNGAQKGLITTNNNSGYLQKMVSKYFNFSSNWIVNVAEHIYSFVTSLLNNFDGKVFPFKENLLLFLITAWLGMLLIDASRDHDFIQDKFK